MGDQRLNKKDKLVLAAVVLAQIVLIALRLGGPIHWHWALVLAPTLFVAGLFFLIVAMAVGIALLDRD